MGLSLPATGPCLAWLPLNFLEALAGPKRRPLPLKFGRSRYRSGFIARRSAEDLAPFRRLEETVRRGAGAELADAQIGEPVSVLDLSELGESMQPRSTTARRRYAGARFRRHPWVMTLTVSVVRQTGLRL